MIQSTISRITIAIAMTAIGSTSALAVEMAAGKIKNLHCYTDFNSWSGANACVFNVEGVISFQNCGTNDEGLLQVAIAGGSEPTRNLVLSAYLAGKPVIVNFTTDADSRPIWGNVCEADYVKLP